MIFILGCIKELSTITILWGTIIFTLYEYEVSKQKHDRYEMENSTFAKYYVWNIDILIYLTLFLPFTTRTKSAIIKICLNR